MKVAVVGAGIAGLLAARTLRDAGAEVVVLDKGRSPGGRLATRRMGGGRVDHGAQFFTVREPEFAALVDGWTDDGVVVEWCRGFDADADGFPRYAARDGMNALAKHLAQGLDVRCGALVFGLLRRRHPEPGWHVQLDDASVIDADAVVVTCPLPQTSSLLFSAGVSLPEQIGRGDYDRTLALLAVLDRPSAVPQPGGVQGHAPFQFVADNQRKGISSVPTLTLHADPEWSAAHWDRPADDILDALCELATPFLGQATVVERQLKRWRFATPKVIWPERCWVADGAALAVAGDAFGGPKVEGAALSGIAAARALLGG